jgi:hypothetical protein
MKTTKHLFLIGLFYVIFSFQSLIAQCACLYYNSDGEFSCELYTNCNNPNLIACGQITTHGTIKLCSAGNPCPQSPGMNWNCGGCQSNGACWYNGNSCNAENACSEIGLIVLPVRLTKFTVQPDEAFGNLILWETSSELNSDYFILQYSSDGVNFVDLLNITASGNSNELLNYSIRHQDPELAINYYRLLQVDFDGQSASYGPISIDNRERKRTLLCMTNIMGQEVTENYTGIVIYYYDDGTTEKIYR